MPQNVQRMPDIVHNLNGQHKLGQKGDEKQIGAEGSHFAITIFWVAVKSPAVNV